MTLLHYYNENFTSGREFTVHSIGIHEPKCLEKWNAEEAKKPKNQRRPSPTRPHNFAKLLNADPSERITLNDSAREFYAEQMRVQCEWCGRKFANEDRLEVHHKSCSQNKPAKKRCETPSGAGPGNGELKIKQATELNANGAWTQSMESSKGAIASQSSTLKVSLGAVSTTTDSEEMVLYLVYQTNIIPHCILMMVTCCSPFLSNFIMACYKIIGYLQFNEFRKVSSYGKHCPKESGRNSNSN
jgi:hypothetical protein